MIEEKGQGDGSIGTVCFPETTCRSLVSDVVPGSPSMYRQVCTYVLQYEEALQRRHDGISPAGGTFRRPVSRVWPPGCPAAYIAQQGLPPATREACLSTYYTYYYVQV